MKATKRSLAIRMAQWAIILALGTSAHAAGAVATDDLYADAKLASQPLTAVALLPVVSVVENPGAERLVETAWIDHYGEVGTQWMPADVVRASLARVSDKPRDLGAAVDEQIWRRGEVEPEVAARLTALLGVDAVLSIRIDRWEIADGGRGVVQMTAVLLGADGTRLWRISGLAGCGVPPRSTARNFDSEMTRIWDSRLEPSPACHLKVGGALYTLLARWLGSLPSTPLYAHEGESVRAERVSID